LAASASVLAISIVGCGDMITYSHEAKAQGISQYDDGHYAEAAGSFRNAIRQDPTDPSSAYWLGMSYEQTNSWHEAIDAYKTCLRLIQNPKSTPADTDLYNNAFDHLASVVSKTDISDTEIDATTKIALADKASEQYRLLGRIMRYRGDADTALDDYRRAVRLSPDNYAATKELGIYLEKLSQNQEAADVLRTAYRENQSDKEVNDALRQIGMVPGPGLLAQDQLAKPLITGDIGADLGITAPAAHTAPPTIDGPAPRD
jgi:tetratricopeptide (TPR) repeat protein